MEPHEQLEQQKNELVTMVCDWPEARLQLHPAAGQWSAAEVFDHLERTERAILEAAKAGTAQPHSIGIRDRLGYIFIEKVFRTDRRVKVPASAKVVLPCPEPKLNEILARWQDTRNDLCAFGGTLTPKQLRQGIFRHPVAGWMDMSRILGFFSVHMQHHAFQLARLRTASEKPD